MLSSRSVKKMASKWRFLLRRSSAPLQRHPPFLKQQFLPVLCVGSTSCKGYLIALHQLTNPDLLRMLTLTTPLCGCRHEFRSLTISCEPQAFEATFCLLQRSFKGLVHIPLSQN